MVFILLGLQVNVELKSFGNSPSPRGSVVPR